MDQEVASAQAKFEAAAMPLMASIQPARNAIATALTARRRLTETVPQHLLDEMKRVTVAIADLNTRRAPIQTLHFDAARHLEWARAGAALTDSAAAAQRKAALPAAQANVKILAEGLAEIDKQIAALRVEATAIEARMVQA